MSLSISCTSLWWSSKPSIYVQKVVGSTNEVAVTTGQDNLYQRTRSSRTSYSATHSGGFQTQSA